MNSSHQKLGDISSTPQGEAGVSSTQDKAREQQKMPMPISAPHEDFIKDHSSLNQKGVPESVLIYNNTIEFVEERQLNSPDFSSLYKDAIEKVKRNHRFVSVATLQRIADNVVSTITKPTYLDSAQQQKLMGRYYNSKCGLPIYQGSIRPELFGMYKHLTTPDLLNNIKKETLFDKSVNVEMLLGVSGKGKTFKMLSRSVHQDYFLIYMILAPESNLFSDFSSPDLTQIIDPCYNLLAKRIRSLRTDVAKNVVVFNEIQVFILARLLYLRSLLKVNKYLTSTEFLEYQLNGYLKCISYIYAEILSELSPWETDLAYFINYNRMLIGSIKDEYGKDVGFGLDEILNTSNKSLLDIFDYECNQFRNLQHFIVREVTKLQPIYVGIAGTSFDQRYVDQYLSLLGKRVNIRMMPSKFDSINRGNIESLLKFMINQSKKVISELTDIHLIHQFLGRKRIFFTFIKNLFSCKNVKSAALVTLDTFRNDLTQFLRQKLSIYSQIFWDGVSDLIIRHLSIQLRGEGENKICTIDPSWIPVGMCEIERNEDGTYLVSLLDEQVLIDTLFEFCRDSSLFFSEIQKRITRYPTLFGGPSFGGIFEWLVVLNLMFNKRLTSVNSLKALKLLNSGEMDQIILESHDLKFKPLSLNRFGLIKNVDEDMLSYLWKCVEVCTNVNDNKMIITEEQKLYLNRLIRLPNSAHQDFLSFQEFNNYSTIVMVEFSIKYSDTCVGQEEMKKSLAQLDIDKYFQSYKNESTSNQEIKNLVNQLKTIPTIKIHIWYPSVKPNTIPSIVRCGYSNLREMVLDPHQFLDNQIVKWIKQRQQQEPTKIEEIKGNLTTRRIEEFINDQSSPIKRHIELEHNMVKMSFRTPEKETKKERTSRIGKFNKRMMKLGNRVANLKKWNYVWSYHEKT
ncbi:predicted protein [Naegleria gruberi]|uniref:Predicted protein n=1 Tax=Naegleria gruberi TaxID=5762 RepID=D2UZJ2_NAEGR|nr:uncharacterized protein NAEGRDRAFT_61957 [Naegleria gruberi]EFC50162.1 predicted protein [Naegleria gruberi]|eukprot:XP_002682906.1 predicted protein [Naegleria gruberi strain NEG-M]